MAYDQLPANSAEERRKQDRTDEAFKSLPDWVRNGRIIDCGTWDPNTKRKVEHGLGREPTEWMLVSMRTATANAPLHDFGVHEVNRDASGITLWFDGASPGSFKIMVW